MSENQNDPQDQPKSLTHDDLNGALAAQKKEFQKMMAQQNQQFQSLLEAFNKNFGPPPEAPVVPTKQVIAEDTAALKKQVEILVREKEQREIELKQEKLSKALRDNLAKHGINSKSDLATKYLQDQVSYDEDGQLVMKVEVTPGVVHPLPLAEAVAKFAQTDHGKFLADPRDIRGSGSGRVSAPGSQQAATAASLITGNSAGVPAGVNDAKSLRQYVTAELGKNEIKF
jgi:hypothetical protein